MIPRSCHRNKWFKKRFTREHMRETIDLCRDCHSAVHDLIPSEKELGRDFNTLDKLLEHPAIAQYVAWIKKQK